jgi:sugar/nucleoside kinase (ribokinase family)
VNPQRILVVGSVALDSIRTPYGEVKEALGGSASYFSCSASHFAPVSVVAVVGEDFPEPHRKLFAGRGIDLSGLEAAPGRTFRWRGEYMAELGHAHTLETQLNVFAEFHPKLTDVHRRIPYVFLANIDPELQMEVLDQMQTPRLTVSDTMNYWIARKPERVLDVLRRVDVALLNEEEARALSGETQLVRAASQLVGLGGKAVIVKKGEHGSLYATKDDLFVAPAYPVRGLQDPTGAGDSFAGGFLGWLARTGRVDADSRRQAMAYGAAMASLAIEAFSPARLIAAQATEIGDRVSTLHRMVEFRLESFSK